MTTRAVPAPEEDPRWQMEGLAHAPRVTHERLVCAFQSGDIRAYDADAAPRWSVRLPRKLSLIDPLGRLLVAGPRILTRHAQDLLAFDAQTGDRLFARRLAGEFLLESAVATSDVLYVQTVGAKGPYTVRAHDLASGREIWAEQLEKGPSELALAGGTLAAVTVDRRAIVAFDAAVGGRRWEASVEEIGRGFVDALQREVQGRIIGSVQIHDRVFIAGVYLHHVIAIDADNGDFRWTTRVPMPSPVNPTATPGGRVDAMNSGSYVSLDAATGRTMRSGALERAPSGAGIDPGYLAYDDGTVYAAEQSGTVFAFDTANARVAWTHALGAKVPLSLPPRLFGGRLFITDSQGRLHAFVLKGRR
jgi:outer membrane protein assembly factor BamB